MKMHVQNAHEFSIELRNGSSLTDTLLSSESIDDALGDVAEETFVRAVLEEKLYADMDELSVEITPVWAQQPIVESVQVRLTGKRNGTEQTYEQTFANGRWSRQAQRRGLQLRDEGTLDEGQLAHPLLIALPRKNGATTSLPPLQPPPIVDATLDQFGVRELDAGEFLPSRPILVNQRLAEDSIAACIASGTVETGRAVLGVHVRLAEPLPQTSTRIVTLLNASVDDARHEGQVNSWKISPEALADASQMADLRGMGESVLTVMHTHGWSNECGNCNENANCLLAECTHVSLMDYQVLETMFPSKATLMPIAGRKLGAGGRQPVLEIHAWRGGVMRPVRWKTYLD